MCADERVETAGARGDGCREARMAGIPGCQPTICRGFIPAQMGAQPAAQKLGAHLSAASAGRGRPTRSVRFASGRRAPRSSRASNRSRRSSNEHVGEIRAQILERDGKIVIEKTCPKHGTFTDMLAINPAFLRAHRAACSRAATFRGHRHAAQPRHVVDQVRPRRGADRSTSPTAAT